MAGVTYIATKRMKVGSGYREVGETVPEAAHWPNLRTYLDNGYVKEMVIQDPLHPNPQTVPIWPQGGGEGAVPAPAPEPEVEKEERGKRVEISKPEQEEPNASEIRVGEVGRVPLGERGRSVYVPPVRREGTGDPRGSLSEPGTEGTGDQRAQPEGTQRSRGSRKADSRKSRGKGAGSRKGSKRGRG